MVYLRFVLCLTLDICSLLTLKKTVFMFFISITTVRLSDTELLDIFYQVTEVLNLRETALNKEPITDMEIYTVLI